jgi:glycosyltransferase involved in cell wall biosynthesis
MKIYYVVNARLPNDKAHGIQIAQMIKAFRALGVELSLVHPHRSEDGLHSWGRAGFVLRSAMFMIGSFLLLLSRVLVGQKFLIYSVDMDTFSYAFLPLLAPTFCEMHSPKPPTLLNRFFFKRVRGIVATTEATREELVRTFSLSRELVTVEPNGVDLDLFNNFNKEDARQKLNLKKDDKIALYVGRLYGWKGLAILPQAFRALGNVQGYLVGGTTEELAQLTGEAIPENLTAVGVRPPEEIPLWLSAANALIVLGTTGNIDSLKYTSPMKVFEYLASGRPIVASETPALREVLDTDVYWYEPDNAEALARAIQSAVEGRIIEGKADRYSWKERTRRILTFIEHA